ncbi:hypothetical protein Pelo_7036 [Pelomyxa schiedti]|nr:hypothetical protein Pelo_7036 [Pelomyxa schiedti]
MGTTNVVQHQPQPPPPPTTQQPSAMPHSTAPLTQSQKIQEEVLAEMASHWQTTTSSTRTTAAGALSTKFTAAKAPECASNSTYEATFLFASAERLKDSSCRFCEFAGSHDNRRPLFDIFAFVPCKEQESLPGSRLSTPIDKLLLCSRLPLVGSKLGSHDNYLM